MVIANRCKYIQAGRIEVWETEVYKIMISAMNLSLPFPLTVQSFPPSQHNGNIVPSVECSCSIVWRVNHIQYNVSNSECTLLSIGDVNQKNYQIDYTPYLQQTRNSSRQITCIYPTSHHRPRSRQFIHFWPPLIPLDWDCYLLPDLLPVLVNIHCIIPNIAISSPCKVSRTIVCQADQVLGIMGNSDREATYNIQRDARQVWWLGSNWLVKFIWIFCTGNDFTCDRSEWIIDCQC